MNELVHKPCTFRELLPFDFFLIDPERCANVGRVIECSYNERPNILSGTYPNLVSKTVKELVITYYDLFLDGDFIRNFVPEANTKRFQLGADATKDERIRELDLMNNLLRADCDHCMCGSRMEDHDMGSGHGPVSMFDYYRDQDARHTHNEALKKALAKAREIGDNAGLESGGLTAIRIEEGIRALMKPETT